MPANHCTSCGTPRGDFHVAACEVEECANCHGKRAKCSCDKRVHRELVRYGSEQVVAGATPCRW